MYVIENHILITMEELSKSIKDVSTRFNGFDQKLTDINKTIKGLKEEVKEYKEEMSSRMDSMESKVKAIEETQTFLSKQYESSRNTTDNILKRDTKREKENAELHRKLKRVEHMLEEERIRRIELAPYLRRDIFEPYGIPAKREEDS